MEPGDLDVISTARREAAEETGIRLVERADTQLVGVDVHSIPATGAEPAHLHHDLMFGFTTDSVEPSGSERAIWCPLDQLDSYGVDKPLQDSLFRMLSPSPPSPFSPSDLL